MKLTKSDRDKWVVALRSGEYKQTRHILFDKETNGFCCLGVFNKVVRGMTTNTDSSGVCFKEIVPGLEWNVVFEQLGIPANILAHQNDSGHSFAQIADWIEANIEVEG